MVAHTLALALVVERFTAISLVVLLMGVILNRHGITRRVVGRRTLSCLTHLTML
jgi:hypothetical protein